MLLPLACLKGFFFKFYKVWVSLCNIIRVKSIPLSQKSQNPNSVHFYRHPWIIQSCSCRNKIIDGRLSYTEYMLPSGKSEEGSDLPIQIWMNNKQDGIKSFRYWKKMTMQIFSYFSVVYDWNHYFGLGLVPKPKPKLANTLGRYCKWYWNHISKGESSYWVNLASVFSS